MVSGGVAGCVSPGWDEDGGGVLGGGVEALPHALRIEKASRVGKIRIEP